MARSKKTATAEETPKGTKEEVKIPDPLSSEEIIFKIFDETFGRYDRGIPVLIGESNWGKTWTVEDYIQKRGYGLTRLFLQSQEPETIQGYDIKETHPDGHSELVEAPPGWLRHMWRCLKENPDQKHILFVDEIDKAREQVLATTLSIFGSGVIKNWTLDKSRVGIIGAMNAPLTPMKPELMSRLLPITFPFAEDQLTRGLSRIRTIAAEYLGMPKEDWGTFDRKKNKGVAHRLESWFDVPEFWKSEGLRNVLIKGLIPHKDIPWWQTRLDPKAFLSMDLMNWIREAGPAEIKDMLLPVFEACQDENERFNAMGELCKRATADPTGEVAQAFISIAGKVHDGIPPIKKV